MTTHAPRVRMPFAPLDNPRLQHLASAKNRQNGAFKSVLGGKPALAASKPLSSIKRSLDVTSFGDDFDSENVDPATFDSPSKKSKSGLDKSSHAFTFAMPTSKMNAPPPPSRLSTPIRANMSSPRVPLTAPAGRSPKRKASGVQKSRRISSPFTRIDPPFASVTAPALPFSLDEALSGSFSQSTARSAGATIQESMPKVWFFEIYQDSPEEEAANLMEHSTLTLDLSSDDESGPKRHDDRGKENTPPEGYDAPTASRSASTHRQPQATEIVRKKVVTDDMDDGSRSPLSDLEPDAFIPEGLTKDAHVIVDGPADTTSRLSIKELFAAPVAVPTESLAESSKIANLPVVTADGDLRGDIIVWEDSHSSTDSEVSTETTPSTSTV